jgi:hypothetical protein
MGKSSELRWSCPERSWAVSSGKPRSLMSAARSNTPVRGDFFQYAGQYRPLYVILTIRTRMKNLFDRLL